MTPTLGQIAAAITFAQDELNCAVCNDFPRDADCLRTILEALRAYEARSDDKAELTFNANKIDCARLAEQFPEINPNKYDASDVYALNERGIRAHDAILAASRFTAPSHVAPTVEARVSKMVESCGVSWWVMLARSDRPDDTQSLYQFREAPDLEPPAEQRARETAAELNELLVGAIAGKEV